MRIVPWSRPRGALHSLARWSEIEESAQTVLVLSDRTLYLLQNLAAVDIAMSARYIASEQELGYFPPEPGTDAWATYVAAYELAQREIIEMAGIAHAIYEPGLSQNGLYEATAGTNLVSVPEGGFDYPVRIDGAMLYNATGVRGNTFAYIFNGSGLGVPIAEQTTVLPNGAYLPPGAFLDTGSFLRWYCYDCQLGDTLYWYVLYSRLLGDFE